MMCCSVRFTPFRMLVACAKLEVYTRDHRQDAHGNSRSGTIDVYAMWATEQLWLHIADQL